MTRARRATSDFIGSATTRSGGGRRIGRPASSTQRVQPTRQELEGLVVDVPRPVRERRRLQLPESERRLDVVEKHRDQAPLLVALLGLVDHPLAVDRGERPQHDHAARLLELALDGAAVSLARHQLAIPEHTPPALFERLFELACPGRIHACVAEEDVGHYRLSSITSATGTGRLHREAFPRRAAAVGRTVGGRRQAPAPRIPREAAATARAARRRRS
jgi:hypothetical protein